MRQKGKLCVKKVRNVDRGKYRINLCIWEGKMSWNSYEKKYPASKKCKISSFLLVMLVQLFKGELLKI